MPPRHELDHQPVESPNSGTAIPVTGVPWAAVFPMNDDLACVAVGWPNAEFHDFRADIEGNYLRTCDLFPDLGERMRSGTREERWVGTADLPNFFRRPHGPDWALVGDAGYHKDPVTGWGISDAFHSAELVAEAIDAGFSGRRPLDEALADYEHQRNESVKDIYAQTCWLASLPAPRAIARTIAMAQASQRRSGG